VDLTIVQRLTCPRGHGVTQLVARVDDVIGGRVRNGLLGCPQCNAEWVVTDGVARFGARVTMPAVGVHDATTIAAFLALTEPGVVIVDGVAARIADELCRDFGALVVSLDPDEPARTSTVIDGAERVPLAPAVARGAVLLRPGRDAAFVESAASALESAGRILAVATLPLAAGLRELARDANFWVAVRAEHTVPVTLRRR
jgi:hypothetical protein